MKKTLLIVLVSVFGLQTANAESKTGYPGDVDGVKTWLYSTPEGAECDQDPEWWTWDEPAEKYEFSYLPSWADGDESQRVNYALYKVTCYAGAYNFGSIFMAKNGITDEFQFVTFVEPKVNYVISQKEDPEFGQVDVVESWSLEGFYSGGSILTNAWVEPDLGTVSYHAKGRGIGDAYTHNIYKFDEGTWLLVYAEADPTYDGQVTPIELYDASK